MIFAKQGTNNRSPGFGNPERHQPMSMQGTGGTRGGVGRVLNRNPNLCQYLRVGFLAKCRDWNPSSDAKRPPSREGRWPLSIVCLWLCHCIPVPRLMARHCHCNSWRGICGGAVERASGSLHPPLRLRVEPGTRVTCAPPPSYSPLPVHFGDICHF